jgi:hypothetical protein
MGTEKPNPKTDAAAAAQPQPTAPGSPAPMTHQNPNKEKLAAALAKYNETLHASTLERLKAAKRADLNRLDDVTEVRKGNMQDSVGWVHGPCIIHLLALAEDRLIVLAKGMGVQLVEGKVARVKTHFPLDDMMVIYPANPNDLSATEIKRSGSSATINVSDKAIVAGVAVESGYKELRPIVVIPDDSELWPGLAIDFALAPLQRKLAVKAKEEDEAEDSDTE